MNDQFSDLRLRQLGKSEILGITKPTKVSIDAAAPGYRRASGTLMFGGDPITTTVESNQPVAIDISLPADRYR